MNLTKERMEPESGPDMVNHDDFISQHESDGFKHHSKEYGKHSSGHMIHHDNVKKMCKGGMR
jgi:hypothetical protein